MKTTRTLALLTLMLVSALLSGCSDHKGRYGDGNPNGKFVDVNANTINIGAEVDGSFVSNDGTIASTTKSSDGKTITLTGEIDYDGGGAGTAFGERHWKRPFTAIINLEEKTMQFQGTLIIDSLTMRTWNVSLKKQ